MATRREILLGAAALPFGTSAGGEVRAEPPRAALASGVRTAGAAGGAVWRDGALATTGLPARGHAMARLPASGEFVLMGRRPGTFAAILDPADLDGSRRLLAPAEGHRFAGHAAVAPEGDGFVTSEFDALSMQALLVKREVRTGAELDRWSLGGLEPHELLYASDGARLVVALGGLVNDGGVAGPALNPGGIDSALIEVDPRSGRVLARHRLGPEHASLSLRHLALAPDRQTVVVGMQDQDLSAARPILGVLRPGGQIELAALPDTSEFDFRGYVGSVAVDASGAFVAATSPRGNLVGLWSLGDLSWLGGLHAPDVCGLASGRSSGEFWASSGLGGILKLRAAGSGLRVEAQWRSAVEFDNHLLRL